MKAVLQFFILLASVHAIELARHEQSVRWGFRYEDDPANLDYAFWWEIQKFIGGNHIAWEDVNRRVGETITLNQDNYGPTFNLFTRLLTDGKNYSSFFVFAREYTALGFGFAESFVFANETGSTNGIDLEGNYIESVAVTFGAFDLIPNGTDWIETEVNFSLVVSGRPELPGDRDLAIITDEHDGFYCPDPNCNSTVWFTVREPAEEPLWWAELEFMFDLAETQEGGMFPMVAEYGNRPLQQMLTSGVEGLVTVGRRRYDGISYLSGTSKSAKFGGLPGVFNGVDFEGNLVEDISLAMVRADENILQLSFMISGVLLEAPPDPTLPPTEPPVSSSWSVYTLPSMKLQVVALVLPLLVGWL